MSKLEQVNKWKMPIREEDIKFLDDFLSDELTEEGMRSLDQRLEDEDFKAYYQKRLDEKYDQSLSKRVVNYLPMIVFVLLVMMGVYLFIKSN